MRVGIVFEGNLDIANVCVGLGCAYCVVRTLRWVGCNIRGRGYICFWFLGFGFGFGDLDLDIEYLILFILR